MDHGPWTLFKPPTWELTSICMINGGEQLIPSRVTIKTIKHEDYNGLE